MVMVTVGPAFGLVRILDLQFTINAAGLDVLVAADGEIL